MSEFIRDLKEQDSERDDLTRIEETLRELLALRIDESDGTPLSFAILPAKINVLMQVGLRRTIELTEAAIREANCMKAISTTVLTRSAFETACLLFDVIGRLAEITDANDAAALDEFDKYITNTLLGHGPRAKTFILAEQYVVQNILTIIQRLSKKYDAPFEGIYENLCEHAHPNYAGMVSIYTEAERKNGIAITVFTDRRAGQATFPWKNSLATCLDLVKMSLTRWAEILPRFATLCERQIYEQGKWPAYVDYPIER